MAIEGKVVSAWNSQAVPMTDASSIGEARRLAMSLAAELGLDEARRGAISILVSEVGQNIVRHTQGQGEIVMRSLRCGRVAGFEVLGIDRGAGIANLVQARRDGYSTNGTPGTGLGAIERQSTEFDIYSTPGRGTVLMARVWNAALAPAATGPCDSGTVCLPKPPETACGDAWAISSDPDRTLVLVADGLGHGFDAAEASRTAVRLFEQHLRLEPEPIVTALHAGLRSTRGAAVAVLEIRPARHQARFVGVGNIAATITSSAGTRSLVSHNGTAGAEARRIQEFVYPWAADSMVTMHTDGLSSGWELARYPGLQHRHAAVIAAVLYRDHRRIRDDVTVLVVRAPREAS